MMNWIKKNRNEVFIIAAILLIAAFLRFYKIDQYMTFLGDEGRDAIVVKKILTQYDFPLLGAPTSVGNMYNGPLYYYMMAVPMAVFWLSPVAAAGMVALIGVLTVGLVYYFGREWFGKQAAIISAFLYAISPVNIIYSRSSWNPNPAPFFALLSVLGLYKAHKTRNYLWMILTGGALAFAVQMHLLALILIPIAGVIWLNELREKRAGYDTSKNFWKGLVLAVIVFLFLMSPLAIFDFKYNYQNYNAFTTFFFGDRATTVNLNPLNTLSRITPIYSGNLIYRYIAGQQFYLMVLVSLLVFAPVVFFLYRLVKFKRLNWSLFALSVWLLGGVMGLSLYKQTVYDHYSSFLNPAVFLLFGSIIYLINSVDSKKVSQYLRGGFFLLSLVLVVVNLQKSPLLDTPNRQLQKTQEISKYIISRAEDKPYNFALLAAHNYDSAYQFYLDIYNHKPKQLPFDITEQLFVVCEDEVCQPINHPKYEIAAFGWAKIMDENQFEGVKVFKLVNNPDGKR